VFGLTSPVPEVVLDDSIAVLHTGSIAATLHPSAEEITELCAAARPHAAISYDPNVRPTIMGEADRVRRRIERLVAGADLVKVSDEDIAWLYPGQDVADAVRRRAAAGPALVVLGRCGGDRAGTAGAGGGHCGRRGLLHGRVDRRAVVRRSARRRPPGPAARRRCPEADGGDEPRGPDRRDRRLPCRSEPTHPQRAGGPRMTSTPTPAEAYAALMEGNARFVAGDADHPNQNVERRAELSSAQAPFAVLFGCSDSRVAAEIIFDRGLGDLFVVRTAGHVVDT